MIALPSYDSPDIQDEDGALSHKVRIPMFHYHMEQDHFIWKLLDKLGCLDRVFVPMDRRTRLTLYRDHPEIVNGKFDTHRVSMTREQLDGIIKTIDDDAFSGRASARDYYCYRVDRLMNIAKVPVGTCDYIVLGIRILTKDVIYPVN